MKINAFGRELDIARKDGEWIAFDLGNEGKRRVARDIVLPANLAESELLGYIADLLHESATPMKSEVTIVE